MAANLTNHQAIKPVQSVSGNDFNKQSIGEKASQTFLDGVPVMVEAASGYIKEWDGTTLSAGIAGISSTYGSNLASNAKGAPGVFGSVGAPGTTSTFGSVPNQSSAVNIAHGAPFSDGRQLLYVANDDTIFEAQVDNGAAGAYATALTQVGAQFGMTKDATGHWYVDLNKTTVGTNTCVVIVALNPNDGAGVNGGRVWFKFVDTACQLSI